MKLCPYNIKKINYVKEYKNDLTDEITGLIKSNKEAYSEDRIMMDCVEGQCGAYYSGRCNYYTAQNETND